MSISPRFVLSKKAKVEIHFAVANKYSKIVQGEIILVVKNPKNEVKTYKKAIKIQPFSMSHNFFYYKISENSPDGKYPVSGKFISNKEEYESFTKEYDFFTVSRKG